MTGWSDLAAAEPDFSARVARLMTAQKHMTLATVRRDGAPRISGTEVSFDGGELVLGMMAGSMKALDLRRDPRLALHSPTVDPPADDPGLWAGDAKVAGLGVEMTDPEVSDGSHRFRIDIAEVVLTKVGNPADHLVIESWTPAEGYRLRQRH